MTMNERLVYACPAAPDAATLVGILSNRHGMDVATVTLDVGERADLEVARGRLLAAGAVRAHLVDATDSFARDFVRPAFLAGVLGDRGSAVGDLRRALVARTVVETARHERAGVVAHGITDEAGARAFAAAVASLDPDLRVVGPDTTGLPMPAPLDVRRHVVPTGVWERQVFAVPADGEAAGDAAGAAGALYALTAPTRTAPDRPARVLLAFEQGVPVAINGVPMPLAELAESLNTIAGHHGVGRYETIRTWADGRRARVVREAPALTVLQQAREDLEQSLAEPHLLRLQRDLRAGYLALLHDGLFFTPARRALDAVVETVLAPVSGTVELILSEGACVVTGRWALDGRAPVLPSVPTSPHSNLAHA